MFREGRPRESLVKFDMEREVDEQYGHKKKKIQLFPLDSKISIQELLNYIIQPRLWKQQNKYYAQNVSTIQSSREDVANLQKLLDQKIMTRQARQSGICPIRQQLHNQCFDQIIRQVTIDCPERGALLMRVRDQLKMTISAYKTLYQSSLTFGMRKQLQSQQGMPQLQKQIQELQNKKSEMKDKFMQLNKKKDLIEQQNKERKLIQQSKRQAEMDFLKYQLTNLQNFLKQANDLAK